MIIAAVADTHGKVDIIAAALRKLKPDYLLFAGDFYRDGKYLSRELKLPARMVSGNCDVDHRSQEEAIVTLLNKRILLVHGHRYGVKRNYNRLFYRAQELNVDAVVFGHTHSTFCEKIEGLWMINPGSAARNRLEDYASYALIEIDEKGLKACIIQL